MMPNEFFFLLQEDGQRFLMQQTLKMLTSSPYNFEIHLERIHSQIQLVKVDLGIEPDVYSSTFVDFNLHRRGNHSRSITFIWDSSGKIRPENVRNKQRDFLTISIIFSDMSIIEIRLQIRFYIKPGKHYRWGEELDHCKGEIIYNIDNDRPCDMIIMPTLYAKPKYFHLLQQQQQQ